MSTLTVAPSETETPTRQCSPSPVRHNQSNNNSQNRQSRQRQRPPILKRSTFQGFRQYPGNVRPRSVSNPRKNFPTLDLDLLQNHFPDQDLEILVNLSNVTIATAWVILQTIVSDVRIEMFLVDNLIRLKEVITEISRDTPIIQTTGQILDTGILIHLNVG